MNEQDLMNFDDIEFAENADPRMPLLIICDLSSSMEIKREGSSLSPLESLNNGIEYLWHELQNDSLSRRRVATSFVTYGTNVNEPTDFATVDDLVLPDMSQGQGVTSTGAAITTALSHLEAYKKKIDAAGLQRYKAMVIIFSDGAASDSLVDASKMVKEGEEKGKFAFFAIGIEGANLQELSSIGHRPAMPLKNDSFQNFFEWLSASASSVSSSNPGNSVALPDPQEFNWTTF